MKGFGLTMDESWESFKKTCINPEAGEVQLTEMRNAFYAGAHVVMSTFQAIGEQDVEEDVGYKVVSDMRKEIADYFNKLTGQIRQHLFH